MAKDGRSGDACHGKHVTRPHVDGGQVKSCWRPFDTKPNSLPSNTGLGSAVHVALSDGSWRDLMCCAIECPKQETARLNEALKSKPS